MMSNDVLRALVREQSPDHADHRAFEIVDPDAPESADGVLIVQCACNVRLTLAAPKATESPRVSASASRSTAKSVPDAS